VPYKALFVEISVPFWDSVGTPMKIVASLPLLIPIGLSLHERKVIESPAVNPDIKVAL
jgi:hypothetical protein